MICLDWHTQSLATFFVRHIPLVNPSTTAAIVVPFKGVVKDFY